MSTARRSSTFEVVLIIVFAVFLMLGAFVASLFAAQHPPKQLSAVEEAVVTEALLHAAYIIRPEGLREVSDQERYRSAIAIRDALRVMEVPTR